MRPYMKLASFLRNGWNQCASCCFLSFSRVLISSRITWWVPQSYFRLPLWDWVLRKYVHRKRMDATNQIPLACPEDLETDLESPTSARIFAPGVGGHEGPLGESVAAVVVVGSAAEDHRAGAHRRRQEHFDVAAPARVQRDDGLHVFQVVDFGLRAVARVRVQRQHQRAVGRDRPGITTLVDQFSSSWPPVPVSSGSKRGSGEWTTTSLCQTNMSDRYFQNRPERTWVASKTMSMTSLMRNFFLKFS